MDISEAILEKTYNYPELTKFHKIVPSIKASQQIGLLGLMSKVGKLNASCAPSANGAIVPASLKTWTPKPVGNREEFCSKDLRATFLTWGLKNGISEFDLTNSDFSTFITMRNLTAIVDTSWRLAWMNNTGAAHWNASPAGYFTNSEDLDYFNIIDGFWVQIWAILADPQFSNHHTTITAGVGNINTQATYALQTFSAADVTNKVVTAALQNMITKADVRLRNQPDTKILLTQSMYDQLYKETYNISAPISAATLNFDINKPISFSNLVPIPVMGVLCYAISFWDVSINESENNGTKWHLPHRAVMTINDNLQIGVDADESFNNIIFHYSPVTNLNYLDWMIKIDAKIPEDYLISACY